MNLPSEFLERMKNLLGNEFEQFLNSYQTPSPVSIRLNPLKKNNGFENEENVSWCEKGKYLKSRPQFVFDPLFHAGTYYVQEASSMLIAQAIDFSRDLKVLDLCAAPGGKSTLLASFLSGNSLLVSNETIKSRVKVLQENIIRWGNPNVMMTNNDSSDFSVLENYFDVIVADAPCSGEGMFRKDEEAIRQWSEKHILHCAERQKRILKNIIPSIKENGLLIYSTCTFSLEENEKMMEWVLSEYPDLFEPVKLNFPEKWNIANGHHADKIIQENAYRLYPHQVNGEGLFLFCLKKRNKNNEQNGYKNSNGNSGFKKIRKNEIKFLNDYLSGKIQVELFLKNNKIYAYPENLSDEMIFLQERLNVILRGIFLGEIKGNDFVPAHDFAMSNLPGENIHRIELSKEDALKFLKKEQIHSPVPLYFDWALATYQQVSLGWFKVVNHKLKNYFPMDWRIRKEISFY